MTVTDRSARDSDGSAWAALRAALPTGKVSDAGVLPTAHGGWAALRAALPTVMVARVRLVCYEQDCSLQLCRDVDLHRNG